MCILAVLNKYEHILSKTVREYCQILLLSAVILYVIKMLIFLLQMTSSCSDSQEWFITDTSGSAVDEASIGQSEYKQVSIRPDVCLSLQVLEIISKKCPVLLLKDVRIETSRC